MDFFRIATEITGKRTPTMVIYPDFQVCRSRDLMVRGKAFYAVWDQEKGLWSTDEYDVQRLVDKELFSERDRLKAEDPEMKLVVKTMANFSSGSWASFRKYVQNVSDSNHILDEQLTFQNTKVKKTDYVSKRLPYSLEPGDISAYEELISTLYSPEEREKIEWCIGAVVSGDSRDIQKFLVLYGEAGAGKSTVLNIIQQLFEGYYTTFEAKALVGQNNTFSTEVFRSNPLVAIQHDGDLSRIEDNTKLNSIISHEEMVMNEKFKASYTARSNAFLFMATNRPVKITDAKSGIIRRLINVKPTGNKVPPRRYHTLVSQIGFELGAIAQHCLDVYRKLGKNYYSDYRPLDMILQTDVFYNFVEANYDEFARSNAITLTRAYEIYKQYCDEALVDFKLPRHKFREELKSYFDKFEEVARVEGKQVRSCYTGFLRDKFISRVEAKEPEAPPIPLVLDCEESLLDQELSDCPAQYASEKETPLKAWSEVQTRLQDLDTRRLHYVRVPENHIVIDFDLKDENGNKSAEANLLAASKLPPTYAEYSKGGQGVHLHYIYDGDVSQLAPLYAKDIEVKVYSGKASLRRRFTKCNGVSIAHISGGLPVKEAKVVSDKTIKTEKGLRALIEKNLKKEIHPGTKPSVDFIFQILEDAYDSGLSYDVRDMRGAVTAFAANSTNHADYCLKKVLQMQFQGKDHDISPDGSYEGESLYFFDIEVFPNLLLVNYKKQGKGEPVVRLINPKPEDIEQLIRLKLIGFNCRRYDNHILYARYLGYSNEELYNLSQKIVSGASVLFSEAYDLSYTDVYDFSSKKQSLKKFEIELGIHHQELGLPWDQPVPKERWEEVAAYCDNDVLATEAVFEARQADWTARKILAAVAGMKVNDTTNSLTTRIIFGDDRKPQSQFNYRFMGTDENVETYTFADIAMDREYSVFDAIGRPVFPGYSFDRGKSMYRGEEVGEGGYVYAEPGMYRNVALLDIASMHPSSIVAENLFGDTYTNHFRDILQARIAIKHKEFDKAREMLGGKLAPFLTDEAAAKDLAQALKIAINSVYGLTAAKFDNPFRDLRTRDNIVAKRGALFMVNLKHEVQLRGFTVAHIKTDSIKIPDATEEIIKFVMDYGKLYGYNFEHEATYDRMCLVNDAVYIARYDNGEWTATGAQFQQPYVFKTLFSKEPIEFKDLCETKTVSTALYLDLNENRPDVSSLEKELEKLRKNPDTPDAERRMSELEAVIAEGHVYQFVGKAGLFCPMKPGCGGGWLVREKDGKFYAATGCKGYRWMESELVEAEGKQDLIDLRYYEELKEEAIRNISQYGPFDEFVEGGDI